MLQSHYIAVGGGWDEWHHLLGTHGSGRSVALRFLPWRSGGHEIHVMKGQTESQKNRRSENGSLGSPEAQIASVTGNEPLASAVCRSVATALRSRVAHVDGGKTVQDVFTRSLNAAIRDIENHPRGKLVRRLIEFGPPDPDEPEATTSDGETTLSDPECGLCVDFICSHMVNCFKGELAELLALEPIVRLIKRLRQEGRLPPGVHLYWGGLVRQRRRVSERVRNTNGAWGSFTKGADGLLVKQELTHARHSRRSLVVHGIVEVKSMARSMQQVLDQIERHKMRLLGGVRLGSQEWLPDHIHLASSTGAGSAGDSLIRVIILPSRWKLSRVSHFARIDARTRALRSEEPSKPPVETRTEEVGPGSWRITLAWSQEALSQAAYEMTVWYMAQVGGHVYARRPLPRGWESKTPLAAGVNMVKHRLYSITTRSTRYLSRRQDHRLLRLYNVHCFGFALAADIQGEGLWPEDIPVQDDESTDEHSG